MSKARVHRHKFTLICAVVVLIVAPFASRFVAARPPATLSYAADIRPEFQTLDRFVIDLNRFDKRIAELGKKDFVSRADFESQQKIADDLRRRLSGVQTALQSMIRKLKASGEYDRLDETVLAKIDDGVIVAALRRESFKKILEAAALQLSNDANQIGRPLDALRTKVRAEASDLILEQDHSLPASRVVRAAYAPAMIELNLRCRIAYLRVGFGKAFTGDISQDACDDLHCFCYGDKSRCDP